MTSVRRRRTKWKCTRSPRSASRPGIQAIEWVRLASSGTVAREPRLTAVQDVRSDSTDERRLVAWGDAGCSGGGRCVQAVVRAFWISAGNAGERKKGRRESEKARWQALDCAETSGLSPRKAMGVPGRVSGEREYGSPARVMPSRSGSPGSVQTGPVVRRAPDSWKRTQ